MRKIGLYLVGICMMFSLAACGGSTEESKENDDIKTEQVSKDLTDAEDKEEDSDAESEGGVQEEISSTEEISYEPTQQVLDAKWHSGLVQVNDKVISLPCKLSDLLAMGFDYEIDDGDEEKGYLFAQNDYVAYNLLLNGERVCFQSFSNKKEGFLTLEDIDPEIESVSLVMRDPGNVTFFLPGGLTLGDAMSSIEEKLGPALGTEAQNESIIYNYGDSSFLSEQLQLGLLLFADRTTQQITSFSIAKNVEYSSVEDATTITAENINNLQSADSHNVQVLFAPDYFRGGAFENDHSAVLEKDGEFYCVRLHFSATLAAYLNPYDHYGEEPMYDVTDENGVIRRVYRNDYNYEVICIKDPFVMTVSVNITPFSKTENVAMDVLQDFVIELGSTIQY